MDRNEYLHSRLKEQKVLLAAHRGTCGGNIIQNTIGAYENALLHGADIIEVDVVKSTDGQFFAFHNGQEKGVFGEEIDIRTMSSGEINKLHFLNGISERISEGVNSLDDILEHFKGRCLINIDRSWFFWKDMIAYLKRHNMEEQIILKSHPRKEELELLEELAPDMMFLPIVRNEEQLSLTEMYRINTIGAEVIFEEENHVLASDGFIGDMHNNGKVLWVNALTLNDTTKLSGGHDDDTAILKNMEEGWGWLLDKKFDMIQTDWPLLFRNFMNRR